jgi:predicted permease
MSGTLAKQRLQRGLVVVQVAVTVVLLAGAGLLTRTMLRLSEVDTGLSTDEVLTIQVNNMLTRAESRDSVLVAAARARLTSMREEIAGLPGVVDVAIGSAPLRTTDLVRDVRAEGRPIGLGEAAPRAELRVADAGYFRAAGIPLLAGRPFSTTDQAGSFSAQRGPAVVIINRRLADRLFPGEDAVGKRIAWTDGTQPVFGDWTTVIGVVGNTQDGGMDAEPRGVVFLYSQLFGGGFVIRADRNVAAQTAPATRIVRRIAPTALIEDAMTVPQYRDRSISPQRLNAVLISSFGVLAMIIAGVGIAGVLAFSVSARTIEIGIRMSLGADSSRVQRMILKEGGLLLAIGLVVGVAGAFLAASVIQKLLFGVPPHDPTTFIGVAVLMAAIGIVACWIPAVRAARIDPAITMRSS